MHQCLNKAARVSFIKHKSCYVIPLLKNSCDGSSFHQVRKCKALQGPPDLASHLLNDLISPSSSTHPHTNHSGILVLRQVGHILGLFSVPDIHLSNSPASFRSWLSSHLSKAYTSQPVSCCSLSTYSTPALLILVTLL